MYSDKHVLLIGGGGTLGSYTAKELLKLGCRVDILCPEELFWEEKGLTCHRGMGDAATLTALFAEHRYDGIVNFIHYYYPDEYPPIHALLCANTDHLIFLSSYRVYADEMHPITEDAPMLLDVSDDQAFLNSEKYAISKAKCEKFLRSDAAAKNYTILRPVISFSHRRLDLIMRTGHEVVDLTKAGKTITLPHAAKNLTAGLDWAGNSGKLIAHMLFKPHAIGEAYTVSSAQNLTWGEVADIYTDLIGAKFDWIDTDAFLDQLPHIKASPWALLYDRLYDRAIDNRKILAATALTDADFTPIRRGIEIELGRLSVI